MAKKALIAVSILSVLVLATIACWCFGAEGHALPPLKPTRHFKARVLVPAFNASSGARPVLAEVLVPEGYNMQMWGNEVTFERKRTDPEISVRSLATIEAVPPASEERPPPPFVDRACTRIAKGQQVRFENRSDGWLVVCRGEVRGTRLTMLARDMRWSGNELQCVVTFSDVHAIETDENDPAAPSDNGNPSSSRLGDAIAVCDSMRLRELTQEEEREHWNGSSWVTYDHNGD